MPEEHVPHPVLVTAMTVFITVMIGAALLFWLGALVAPGGPRGVIGLVGPGLTALFGAFHIPAAIVGILLLQWRRSRLRPVPRVVLEAGTLYFGLAVLVGIFFNYLMASFLDEMLPR